MKTIEEGALDHIHNTVGEFLHKDQSFKAGVDFAQRWIPVEEELPENLMVVTNDGLHSYTDNIIYKTVNGKYGMTCRTKFLDHKFIWKGSGTLQDSITHWRPIELK